MPLSLCFFILFVLSLTYSFRFIQSVSSLTRIYICIIYKYIFTRRWYPIESTGRFNNYDIFHYHSNTIILETILHPSMKQRIFTRKINWQKVSKRERDTITRKLIKIIYQSRSYLKSTSPKIHASQTRFPIKGAVSR